MAFKGRFRECRTCIHFRPEAARECLPCSSGQFYEPIIEEDPDEEDLNDLMRNMSCDD